MSFKDCVDKGWLTTHKASPSEISELFGIADRDLKGSARTGGSILPITLPFNWRQQPLPHPATAPGVTHTIIE
jgi:hypothetical protein